MTIDERLQFLVQSTESLHASRQELNAMMRQQSEENRRRDEGVQKAAAREARLRAALLDGIAGFLEGLDDDNGDETKQ